MKDHENKVPVLANKPGVYTCRISYIIYEKFFTPKLSFCLVPRMIIHQQTLNKKNEMKILQYLNRI